MADPKRCIDLEMKSCEGLCTFGSRHSLQKVMRPRDLMLESCRKVEKSLTVYSEGNTEASKFVSAKVKKSNVDSIGRHSENLLLRDCTFMYPKDFVQGLHVGLEFALEVDLVASGFFACSISLYTGLHT
jgi:hypothetical protein